MANFFEYFKGTLTELIQKSKEKSSTLTKAIVAPQKIADSPTLMVAHANFGFVRYTLEKAVQRYNIFLIYANFLSFFCIFRMFLVILWAIYKIYISSLDVKL